MRFIFTKRGVGIANDCLLIFTFYLVFVAISLFEVHLKKKKKKKERKKKEILNTVAYWTHWG